MLSEINRDYGRKKKIGIRREGAGFFVVFVLRGGDVIWVVSFNIWLIIKFMSLILYIQVEC